MPAQQGSAVLVAYCLLVLEAAALAALARKVDTSELETREVQWRQQRD